MTNGLFSMFSSLIANTPPYRKGLSSRKFLSLFLILFLAVGNSWGQETVIYSTDVKENPNSPATATTGKASYSTTSVDWASAYSNYLKTTGSDGYYQLDFNPVIDLTAYVDIKIKIYWGATANRPLKISIDNGTSTEIDKVGSSSERSKVREIELELSANSIKTIKLNSSGGGNVFLFRIEIVGTSTSSGGGDPVDPTFTYTPTTYTIGDPALDLSTKLTSNSGGAISFAVSTADAGTTGASIANGKDFTATTAGTATITVTQAETTGYNAKTQDIAVSVVEPDPCTTYYHFVATADATANGKTNWSGFTNAPTGSDGQDNSVTIDGTTYTLKKRTGSTGKGVAILGFTIPANKAGTLYGYMKSSGSAGRTLSLKKGDEVVATNTEIVDGNWTLITINAIPQGTYTLIPNDNVRIQMFALKVCDAVFHTVTFNSNGGSSVVEQSVLDGAPAIQPTDPTWEHHRFDGWYNGENPYDWTANVTDDLTLTAHWTQLYTITYAAGDGTATGDAPTQVDKAEGETFTVAANTFEVAGKDFVKWNDGTKDYNPEDTYTVGTDNIVLTAQWKAQADKYTVKFMDGETVLDTKLVEVGSHPADIEHPTKPLYTFAAWQLSGSDVNLDEVSGTKDDIVTLTARWTAAYASNVNFKETETQALGVETALNTYHYASDASDISFEEKGLKIKTNAARFYFNVAPGKVAEIKFGNISGATYSVDGGAAETLTSSQLKATYSANAQSCVMTMTTAAYNIVEKVTIHDPFTVTFDANGGDDIAAVQGKPSITLPEPTNGIMSFKGWYDAATEGNKIGDAGEEYTPTADVTIYAQWEAQSTINTLSDLKVNGETVLGFAANEHTYRMVLPYKSALPMITSATPTNANAKVALWPVDGPEWTDEYDGGCYRQQVVVTPQDPAAEKGYYDIRITIAPKDGVSIISIAVPNGNGNEQTIAAANITGYIGGTATQKLQSGGTKLGSNGHYIGFTLANSETLKEGDVIRLNVSATNGASHLTLYQNASDANPVKDIEWAATTGVNLIPLPAEAAGLSTLYIYRKTAVCNPNLSEFTILRPMNPVLAAITFDGEPGVIDEAKKEVTVELPFSSNVASMVVEPTIAWNAPATTNSIVVNDGNWVVGDNTYVLTDKDGDQTTYTITLTQAAAIKEVVISGTLSVLEEETTTLSATVIDTNDAEASNQNVTWTSNDETTAIVDANGVVTGVKAGTVKITATSVADNTKSASVTITVTENPCRTWNAPAESFSGDITKGKLSIKNSGCSIDDVTPFLSASKVYAYRIDGSSDYVELSFTDKSQFESLTLGVSSGSDGSSPTFAVVASKSAVFDEKTIVEIFTYNANAKDAVQSLVDVNIPEGTRNVRIYRKYNDIGSGSSVSVYYVNACKKDFVPLTSVSLADANLAVGRTLAQKVVVNPANADIQTTTWSIESTTATGVTIDAATGVLTAAADATEGTVSVKVQVTDILGNTQEATATITIITEYTQANITESIIWDWTVAAMGMIKTENNSTEYLMANVNSNVVNNDDFRSDMLLITAEYANRELSNQFLQGTKIRFKTTVDGLVRVYFRSTGEGKNVEITINGISAGSGDAFQWSNYIEVPAGEVTIVGTGIGENATGLTRIQKIEFLALGHRREASWIVPNELGTVCLKDACIIKGAELYELQGPDENRKLVFDEILSGELEAGKPYLFNATATGRISFYNKVDAAHTETAGSWKGMYGTFEDITFSPATDQNIYYFSGHSIWAVKKNTADVELPAYLCYVKMDEFLASPVPDANPAPGRRRVTLGVNGQQVATGVDQVQGDEVPTKMMINGQLFILRGEKMYDAQGKLVK